MTLVVSSLLPRMDIAAGRVDMAAPGLVLSDAARFVSDIDVTGSGAVLRLTWPQVAGATEVALEGARVVLMPPAGLAAGTDLGELRGAHRGERCTVTIPAGPRPVRSLYLRGLRLADADETPLPDRSSLIGRAPRLRLALAIRLGGVLAPVGYAVPHIGPNPGQPPYVTPPLLAGATYSEHRLSLPDVMAEEIRIMVVSGDAPEDFAPVPFALDAISARAAPSPVDVTISDGTGAPFYTGTGPVVTAVAVDARNAVQRALDSAIAEGVQPQVTLTVTGRTPGRLGTTGIVASGEIRRVFDDKLTVALDGAPVTLAMPGPEMDARVPSSAVADVVVDYAGLRLHPLSDMVPLAAGGLSGPVLTMEAPLWRALPPQALRGATLRRVGLIGYGLTEAELSIRVLGAAPDGSRIAPHDLATGTCSIPAPDLTRPRRPQVIWCDLGDGLTVDQPIGIEVTAVRGRFLWIADDHVPLGRLAVAHALSGAETLRIGSHTVPITGPRTTLNARALAPADFTAAPVIASEHFLTLTLSRLRLGYAP